MHHIDEAELNKVIEITRKVGSVRYPLGKKAMLREVLEEASETTKWLLAFFTVVCLFCPKLRPIDVSRYNYIPSLPENKASFSDFVRLIRRYEDVNITPSREHSLVKFIARCDKPFRDLFLSVMSKNWLRAFPVTEMQLLLPLDDVSVEEVYGELGVLKTKFSELNYPVALRSIPEGHFHLTVLCKNPNAITNFIVKEGKVNRATVTDSHRIEAIVSPTPKFAVVSLAFGAHLYPIDFFEDIGEFIEGGTVAYEDRITALNVHLSSSIPMYTDNSPIHIVNSEDEFIKKLGSMHGSGILVSDTTSAKTERYVKVNRNLTCGVIASIWAEEGVAKGFNVWFNGELYKCTYFFTGAEEALLGVPESVVGKVLAFYCIEIGAQEYLVGKSIEWGSVKWRVKKLRGTEVMLSWCALCGSADKPHANHGLCKQCEVNMEYYFTTYGVGSWIKPSAQMVRKRANTTWRSKLLNTVGYRFKGYRLVARDDGYWQFSEDEESMQKYKEFINV